MKKLLKNRAALFGGLLLLVAVPLAVWSVNWMENQRAAATETSEDLILCREMERAMNAMRKQTTLASSQAMETQELAQRIDNAAREARMNPASLDGVYPQPNRRMGNSPYAERPTLLVLRNVELRPLTEFLYHLTGESQLNVRQLHLRTPHGDTSINAWDVDATITSLIYAPSENARGE